LNNDRDNDIVECVESEIEVGDDVENVENMLYLKTAKIAKEIVKEEDINKIKDLTELFNLNQKKKNVIRLMKYDELLDCVTERMIQRFNERADEISSYELLNYLQGIQSAIEKSQKSVDLVKDVPAIQFQQNNFVSLNGEAFNRESRAKIADAIRAIISRANVSEIAEAIEAEIVTESEEEDE